MRTAQLLKKYPEIQRISGYFHGSGRRIRTLTYGVRVRCATFTQSRFISNNAIITEKSHLSSYFFRDLIFSLTQSGKTKKRAFWLFPTNRATACSPETPDLKNFLESGIYHLTVQGHSCTICTFAQKRLYNILCANLLPYATERLMAEHTISLRRAGYANRKAEKTGRTSGGL